MRIPPPLFALLLFALLLPGIAARSDAPTVVPVRTGTASDVRRCDLGEIAPAGATPLSHTFLLRNDGAAALTISRFEPSCHCTSASLVSGQALPITLAPGAQAAVRVSIVVEPYLSGPLEKSVWVFTPSQDAPVATLTIDALLRPLVALTPPTLDFGVVRAGTPRSLTLRASVPQALAPVGGPPRLLASDPDLRVTPLSASPKAATGTSTYTTYSYRVTLARDAALGPVRALLQFAPSAGAASVSGLTLADGPGVPVTGSVHGSASASPARVAFGIVPQGRAASVRLTLTSGQAGTLASARAAADAGDLRPTWRRGAARTRILVVTLAATSPPGPVQSQVTVTLADGEHLRLPVSAYVTAR